MARGKSLWATDVSETIRAILALCLAPWRSLFHTVDTLCGCEVRPIEASNAPAAAEVQSLPEVSNGPEA